MNLNFKSYSNYTEWLNLNWNRTKELDELIILLKLVKENKHNCSGEAYRSYTKDEFNEIFLNGNNL